MAPQFAQRGVGLPLRGANPFTFHHSRPRYQPPTIRPTTSINPVIFTNGRRELSHSMSCQIMRRSHIAFTGTPQIAGIKPKPPIAIHNVEIGETKGRVWASRPLSFLPISPPAPLRHSTQNQTRASKNTTRHPAIV